MTTTPITLPAGRVADPAVFRQVLGHVPTSVAIAAAIDTQGPFGIVIGSLVSISLDPPLVGMFIDNGSRSLPRLLAAPEICINVLGAEQGQFCKKFSRDKDSRFQCDSWHAQPEAAPRLRPALAWIAGSLDRAIEIGDHHLIVLATHELKTNPSASESDPLIFFRGAFAA